MNPKALYDYLEYDLRGRDSRVVRSGHGRTVIRTNEWKNTIVVRLWETDIIEVGRDSLDLNTGGWNTVTTMRRMNEYLRKADMYAYRDRGRLTVYTHTSWDESDRVQAENDVLQFRRANNDLGWEITGVYVAPPKPRRVSVQDMALYAHDYVRQMLLGWPDKQPTFCWYCRQAAAGNPTNNREHLHQHVRDGEYPGALPWIPVRHSQYAPDEMMAEDSDYYTWLNGVQADGFTDATTRFERRPDILLASDRFAKYAEESILLTIRYGTRNGI